MKYFYLITIYLFATSLLWSCGHERQLYPKKALITGKIENFDKYSNKNWIKFMHPDLFSHDFPFKEIEIGSDGSFRYEAELVSPALCWGIYNKWFPFVLSPGDSINLSIDGNIWQDQTNNAISKGKYIEISGTTQDDYFKIINFKNWASDSIYSFEKSVLKNEAIKKKSPEEFKQFLYNNERHVLKCIKDFGEKQNAGGLFHAILNAEIHYRTLDDLIRYWWVNPLKNAIKFEDFVLPANYFSFLDNYNMSNEDFFVQNRIDFIKELPFFLQFQNSNERTTFVDIHQNKEKAQIKDEYFKSQAVYIGNQTKGITRDLCLHFFALYNLDKVPSKSKEIYSSVSELIEDPYVKEQFGKLFNSNLDKIKPQIDKISNEEYTALDSLISKYPGKVVYVDFWAPWCSPCMAEMPYSKQLKESFSGKDIIFIYLACDCTAESWKATIANNDIDGVNLLLSHDDYEILKRRFGISGIPHFLLINKKGEIVSKDAPRPSNENIKTAILELL